MRSFISKDGRQIIPVDHIASFKGKCNSCKSKVLLILNHFKDKYLTAREINEYTGVSYEYLEARLSFWYNIRYVNRKPTSPAKGRPIWKYQIAERGKRFVELRMPPNRRDDYINEINAWLNERRIKSTAKVPT